jgi:hypothetical protein
MGLEGQAGIGEGFFECTSMFSVPLFHQCPIFISQSQTLRDSVVK